MELGGSHQNLKQQFDYKFNGKQENGFTGLIDFGGRYLDRHLGVWAQVDPLAEKFTAWSPYSAMANNPIIFFDADGREPVPSYQRLNPWFTLKPTQWYSTAGIYDNNTFNAAAAYSTQHLRADAFQTVYQ